MNIFVFVVGMPVRSMWTITCGASDSRPVADFSRASLIVACVWPFCVSMTASDFERNLPMGAPLPRPGPRPPASAYVSAWRNTVTSIRCLPNPRSLNCISRRRRMWSPPSRATRPLLPRMTVPARCTLPLLPKHVRASTIMIGIIGAYSLELISRYSDDVMADSPGRSYPNILM